MGMARNGGVLITRRVVMRTGATPQIAQSGFRARMTPSACGCTSSLFQDLRAALITSKAFQSQNTNGRAPLSTQPEQGPPNEHKDYAGRG